jgi:hypothetical protein
MANATDDNSNLVDMDDFKNFEDLLFERTSTKEPEKAEEEAEEVDENDDNSVATEDEEDTNGNEDEGEGSEDEDSEDETPEPKAKGKKNRTQERIEKLVAEARVAQRERDALMAELNALKASKEADSPKTVDTIANQLPPEAPKPDAVNDKGEPVYPLGEFDPLFIRDLTKFTIEQETKAAKEQMQREEQEKAVAQQRNELQRSWNERVEKVVEDLPDFAEKVQGLASAFVGVDAQYGDYLATTVMQCDNGPEIMYYLSQNIDEAQKIVASGPLAATLAIGRLQAKFERQPEREVKSNKKVSNAPTPPPTQSRGKGGHFTVRGDTEDLAAFERDFFK